MKYVALSLGSLALGYGVAKATDNNAEQCVDIEQYSSVEYEHMVWSIDGKVLGFSTTEDAGCIVPPSHKPNNK